MKSSTHYSRGSKHVLLENEARNPGSGKMGGRYGDPNLVNLCSCLLDSRQPAEGPLERVKSFLSAHQLCMSWCVWAPSPNTLCSFEGSRFVAGLPTFPGAVVLGGHQLSMFSPLCCR